MNESKNLEHGDNRYKKPCLPRPAKIYWGTYRNMEQLTHNPEEWDFTAKHTDGMLFHFAYWGNDNNSYPVAKELGKILKRYPHLTIRSELGFPGPRVKMDTTMAKRMAVHHLEQIKLLESNGIRTQEMSIDYMLYAYKNAALDHPDWSTDDIISLITGDRASYPGTKANATYWSDYIQAMLYVYPEMKFNFCFPTVYLSWDGEKAFNGHELLFSPLTDWEGNVFYYEGREIHHDFSGNKIVNGLINAVQDTTAPENLLGYVADSPYDFSIMGGDKNTPEAIAYRKRLRSMENFMHQRDLKFTLIVNTGRVKQDDPIEWDKQYCEDSMNQLKLYQADGGRADNYTFESWYSGPNRLVPETEEHTFTHMMSNVIQYLKGPGQSLDLSVSVGGNDDFIGKGLTAQTPESTQTLHLNGLDKQNVDICLTNCGDVACLPCIYIQTEKCTTIINEKDISEWYTLSNLVEPGQSVVIPMEILPTENKAEVYVSAFWNPQDATQTIRDVIKISFE